MPAKFLMIQGTASHVGKTVIVAALCRIFANRGIRVAPFKAQNMALNSAVTADGLEVGRSTAVQAKAARTELRIEMNPVLLKPKAETIAQIMLLGKPYGDVSASDQFQGNHSIKDLKLGAIRQSLETLSREFDLIIIEGAGSPAEVNLRQFDVVNMAVAELVNAPVLLVADIDRGGAIAALVGTYALLTRMDRHRITGFIINKFRGDKRLLEPALDFIKTRTSWPALSVIPYHPGLNLIQEEDTLQNRTLCSSDPEIEVAVVEHPHLSNFTDLDPLNLEPGVMVRYIQTPAQLGTPDAVVLPGTKNTTDDIRGHFETGLDDRIQKLASEGTPILGICGGYQMLGRVLLDPLRLESRHGTVDGLGLLDVITEFRPGKITRHVSLQPTGVSPFLTDSDSVLTGYEIHSGNTMPVHHGVQPAFFRLMAMHAEPEREGAVNAEGNIVGTSVHGLFDNNLFRRHFVNVLRKRRSLAPLNEPVLPYLSLLDEQLEEWADWVEGHMDMRQIERLLFS